MENNLTTLLESTVLNEETKSAINEAWVAKINEAKEEITEQVRSEFASRFNYDKQQLIEAMDHMLNDALKEYSQEHFDAVKNLKIEKINLSKSIKESRAKSKSEIMEFRKSYNELNKLKVSLKEKYKKDIRNHKNKLNEGISTRVNHMEKFLKESLSKEVSQLYEDRKQLQNAKFKLVTEAKNKMDQAKSQFIKKTANLTESFLNKNIRSELFQLKEDIRIAKENTLGQKLFEQFYQTYLSNPFSDRNYIRQTSKRVSSLENQLLETRKNLSEKETILDSMERKIKLSEDTAQRDKLLTNLLSPLPFNKKEIMKELLNGVKTKNLTESYERYLPNVIGNDAAKTKTIITEKTQEVTGDRKNSSTNINETNANEFDDFTNQIIRLSGIQK